MEKQHGAVVITGASTGIGEACAIHLDKLGFEVFAGVRKDADADKLKQASASIKPVKLDIVDSAGVKAVSEKIAEELGGKGLAGLVNNAGIVIAAPLEYVSAGDVRWQMEVNVTSQVAVTQAFLPLIRKATGRIVNMGSISGKVASPFVGPYCMSKFALEAFNDALRRELKPWNIEVSLIEPGVIKTPIWNKTLSGSRPMWEAMPGEMKERYGKQLDALEKTAENPGGISPDYVAKAVEHALTARRPKIRYPVGRDAKMGALLTRLLPDRLLDAVLARD